MNISISGQHIHLPSSLQEHIKIKLTDAIKKYLSSATSATVHFDKKHLLFSANIMVNSGTGQHIRLKSSGTSEDIFTSFDLALLKLEKQLRKYKSKLKDRTHRTKASELALEATKYTISPYSYDHTNEDQDIDNPIIIAEQPTEILSMSVGEAVMKMDLENLTALMFKNIKNNKINIVYYRKDGNIAWVESKSP